MELLDALRQRRVLWVSCQHSRLVQVLSTVLHTVYLHTHLHRRLLEVSVGSHAHGLSRPDLTTRTRKLRSLLIHGHCLIDVGLHQLVLILRGTPSHAFVSTLT